MYIPVNLCASILGRGYLHLEAHAHKSMTVWYLPYKQALGGQGGDKKKNPAFQETCEFFK